MLKKTKGIREMAATQEEQGVHHARDKKNVNT